MKTTTNSGSDLKRYSCLKTAWGRMLQEQIQSTFPGLDVVDIHQPVVGWLYITVSGPASVGDVLDYVQSLFRARGMSSPNIQILKLQDHDGNNPTTSGGGSLS